MDYWLISFFKIAVARISVVTTTTAGPIVASATSLSTTTSTVVTLTAAISVVSSASIAPATKVFPVTTSSSSPIVVPVWASIGSVFYKRTIVEFKLAFCYILQFCLNIIIMYQLFMPIAVG